jgi:hypothetical protein
MIMASTGAARAKVKHAVADATIKVIGGYPQPADVDVRPEGTVQFVNEDTQAYRVRLWTRDESEKHADVDTLLPARSGITVMVDPEIKEGKCRYSLIPTMTYAEKGAVSHAKVRAAVKGRTAVKAAAASRNTAATAATTGGGTGGGTIKIGGH